jgi:hypothetical protein
MKRISIILFLFMGSLLVTLLYSCIKEGLSQNGDQQASASKMAFKNTNTSFRDSGCSICSENKQAILTPANFFGPITYPGIEMNSKFGTGTISDAEVQAYKKLNVTVLDAQGTETAIPFFNMAADGSYESISYKRGSSYLMIMYVRFNKSTNTFTYKPVNNLTVKYGLSYIN